MSFDVLSAKFNPHQSLVLEASAGTGKTFSIENIVLRALLADDPQKGSRTLIDEILVVTFTKAAALELKNRIRRNLESSWRLLLREERTNAAPFLCDILDQGPDSVREACKRIKQALIEFDRASIFTIHSFCYRALLEHAIESKSAFRIDEGPEQLSQEALWELLEKYFLTELSPKLLTSRQLEILLRTHRNSVSDLARKLLNDISRGIPIKAPRSCQAIYQEFLKCLEKLKGEGISGSDLMDEFHSKSFSYCKICIGKTPEPKCEFLQPMQTFAALLDQKNVAMEHFERVLAPLCALLPLFSRENRKSAKRSEPSALLERMNTLFAPLLAEAYDAVQIFALVAADCQKKLWDFFDENDRCDFSYLLIKMEKLICGEALFRARLQARYKNVIIDEFQDTDPLQWSIFKSLFIDSAQHVHTTLVGDPKQSIYSFRTSDVYTYMNAADVINEGKRSILDTNYRSTPSLIRALNCLFDPSYAPDWMPLPERKTSIPILPVKASPKSAWRLPLNEPSCHFLGVEAEAVDKQKKVEYFEDKYFFPFFVEEVKKLHERGVPLREIAFLVRDHKQAERLYLYFTRNQLPVTLQRTEALQEADGLKELIYLLKALRNPRDLSALKTALGGKIAGLALNEIEALDGVEELAGLIADFSIVSRIWKESGIATALDTFFNLRLLQRTKTVRDELLMRSRGLQLYDEVWQSTEWLMEHSNSQPLSPAAQIKELESLAKTEQSSQENLQLRQNFTREAIPVMTLHMSKGLEFDVVFTLGAVNRTPVPKGLISARVAGSYALQPVSSHEQGYSNFLEETDAEKSRQLYVALTRARERLYIPLIAGWNTPKLGSASPLELFLARFYQPLASWGELYERMENISLQQIERFIEHRGAAEIIDLKKLEPAGCAPFTNRGATEILVPPKEFEIKVPAFFNLSFSGLAKPLSKSGEKELKKSLVPHDFFAPDRSAHTLPAGSETGELMHLLLQKVPFSLVRDAKSSAELEPFVYPFTQGSPFEVWADVFAELIFKAFKTPLWPNGPRLCQLDECDCFREMEFLYPLDLAHEIPECLETHGVMKGVIDLFFTFEGKYYLLDWKTNWLGPDGTHYEKEQLEGAMSEHRYDLQAKLYRLALQQYLKAFNVDHLNGCFFLFLRGFDGQRGLFRYDGDSHV